VGALGVGAEEEDQWASGIRVRTEDPAPPICGACPEELGRTPAQPTGSLIQRIIEDVMRQREGALLQRGFTPASMYYVMGIRSTSTRRFLPSADQRLGRPLLEQQPKPLSGLAPNTSGR